MESRERLPARTRTGGLHRTAVISTVVVTGQAAAAPVLACSVCGGNPESELARGATLGVLVLAVIAYALLTGMSALLVTWTLRARRLSNSESAESTQSQ